MQIYIRRDNEDFGPYSREVVLEFVKQGVFEPMDPACYAGMAEWKTLGELLGIKGTEKPRRGTAPIRAAHITEFNPEALPEPPPMIVERRTRPAARRGRGSIMALNVALVTIVLIFAMMRTAAGRRVIRYGLLSISAGLAHLASAPIFTNEPASGAAEAKASSPAPSAAPSAAAAPAPVAAVTNAAPATSPVALAAHSPAAGASVAGTPALGAVAAASPQASAPSQASASPAMVAGDNTQDDADTPPAAASAASPATPAPPTAAPAPSTAAPAATPVAAPPAAATPPPPPKPFDPADLAGNPASWPKRLHLRQAVEFPALYNGQVVGSVTAPAGTLVTLDNIQGGQLTVDYQGGSQKIPWTSTDLAQAAAKLAPPPPPASTAPPAAPSGLLSPPTSSAPPDTSAPPASDNN